MDDFNYEDMSNLLEANMQSIIKVIGVGGGGGNAVNHMCRQGIVDVSFAVCNTDMQALKNSPVSQKIVLGDEGLGAGGRPENGRAAVEKSLPKIEQLLTDTPTKMVFVTAGMGGGTGTGAAPVIAKLAHDMGILTVGIVTIPFAFEGAPKIRQALAGVVEMSKNVDALLVINNERLCKVYPNLDFMHAFATADEVVATAAKGIAEIITVHGYMNVDFADVNTIMKDSGVAVMNTGCASGERRITKAIENALNTPLLDNTNVRDSKKVLLNLSCSSKDGIKMEELSQLNEFMAQMRSKDVEVISGVSFDDSLEDQVRIILIATGFSSATIPTAENINKAIDTVYDGASPKSDKEVHLEDLDNDDVLKEYQCIATHERN